MTRARVWLAVALLAGTSLAGAAPSAAASPVSGLAWGSWWEADSGSLHLPPPPTVPAKGLWVEDSVSGPTVVSAVRFTLSNATSPTLKLAVRTAEPAADMAIEACPTTSAWTPADAGPWAARPTPDCSVAARGTLSADASALVFDLSGLPVAKSGLVDVVLVPVPAASGSAPATFDATFPPPTTASITTTPAAPSQAAPDLSPPVTVPPAALGTPANASTGSDTAVLEPSFSPPGAVSVPTATPPETLPSVGSLPVQAAPESAPVRTAQAPARDIVDRLNRHVRWLLAMIVLDAILYAGWQGWLAGGKPTKERAPSLR